MPRDEDVPFFLAQELIPGYWGNREGTYCPPKGYFVADEHPEAKVRRQQPLIEDFFDNGMKTARLFALFTAKRNKFAKKVVSLSPDSKTIRL